MIAILRAKNMWSSKVNDEMRQASSAYDMCKHELWRWGIIQHSERGWFHMVRTPAYPPLTPRCSQDAEAEYVMKGESIEPDSWIVPPRMTTYAAMGQLAETEVYRAGEATARSNLMRGADNFTTFRGKNVYEIKPYNIDVDGRVVDPLNRSRMIGDFFVVPFEKDTQVYCCQSDRFETFTWDQCAKHAGIDQQPLTKMEEKIKDKFHDLFDPNIQVVSDWSNRARRSGEGSRFGKRAARSMARASASGVCVHTVAERLAAQVPDFDARAHALLPQMHSAAQARQAMIEQLAHIAADAHACAQNEFEQDAPHMIEDDVVQLVGDPEAAMSSAAQAAAMQPPRASGSTISDLVKSSTIQDNETKQFAQKLIESMVANANDDLDESADNIALTITAAFRYGLTVGDDDNGGTTQEKYDAAVKAGGNPGDRLRARTAWALLVALCKKVKHEEAFNDVLAELVKFVTGYFPENAPEHSHIQNNEGKQELKKKRFISNVWPKRRPDLVDLFGIAVDRKYDVEEAVEAAKGLFAIANEHKDILCFRPFRQYTMGTGVLCRSGSELGNTFRCAGSVRWLR